MHFAVTSDPAHCAGFYTLNLTLTFWTIPGTVQHISMSGTFRRRVLILFVIFPAVAKHAAARSKQAAADYQNFKHQRCPEKNHAGILSNRASTER